MVDVSLDRGVLSIAKIKTPGWIAVVIYLAEYGEIFYNQAVEQPQLAPDVEKPPGSLRELHGI